MIKKRLRHTCSKNKKTVSNWTGTLKGIPCFLVGCGPSLDDNPIHKIDEFFSIGINSSYKKFDPTILIWQDVEFWYQVKRDLKNIHALKYCRDISDPSGTHYHFKLMNNDFKHTKNPMVLNGRGNTGALAFELAYNLGCNPIILLGFDCRYRGRKTDFFGTNTFHKPYTLKLCTNGLQWIKHNDDQKRLSVINCSDNFIFENRFSLDEAIEMVKDKYTFRGRDMFLSEMFSPKK